jgi:hypothetical protein
MSKEEDFDYESFKEYSNASSKLENFIALYDREPTDSHEIAIKKNDRLILIERVGKDMLRVKNIRSKRSGLINVNMVKSFTNMFESQE